MADQKNTSDDRKTVTPPPGKAYCNWIPLAKQKLKTRDRRLIQLKLQQIETIVNDTLQSQQYTYTIPQNITRQIFEDLFRIIDAWNGVRNKATLPKKYTFKQYFNIAKKYNDAKKLIALGSILWLPIFKNIAQILPNDFDTVIYALFMSKIEYDKTKKHSLINATTVVRSKELQSYLLNVFPSLKIRKWVSNATAKHSSSVAATVFKQICYKLFHILHDQSELSTDCTVAMGNGLYSQNPQMYGGSMHSMSNAVTVPSQTQPSMCDCVCVCNNNNNRTFYTAQNPLTFNPQMYGGMHSMRNTVTNTFHSQPSTVRMGNNNRNNQFQSQNLWTNYPFTVTPMYGGSHSMTNTVSDARYSPLLSTFAPVTHFQKEFVCNCSFAEIPKIWNGFNSSSRGHIPQRMDFNNLQISNVNGMKPIRNIFNGFVQAPNNGNAFAEPISNSDGTESIATMFPWNTQSMAPIIPSFTQSMDSMLPFGNDLLFEN